MRTGRRMRRRMRRGRRKGRRRRRRRRRGCEVRRRGCGEGSMLTPQTERGDGWL